PTEIYTLSLHDALPILPDAANGRSPLPWAPACEASLARIVSIGEFGPSSALVRRATSAATSLRRSRSTAFSMRSLAQVVSANERSEEHTSELQSRGHLV